MDCSAISEYDNLANVDFSASESVLYQAVNNVLSATTTNGNKMFCPLCVETFQLKFALLDHLRRYHSNFLQRAPDTGSVVEQCPFCYANFFGRHTVIRHALRMHSRLIAQLYLNVRDGPDVKCFFCSDSYDKRRASKFASHIERDHFLQFADVFDEQFMTLNDSLLSPESPAAISRDKENCFDFTRLKEELCYMDDKQSGVKSVPKGRKSTPRTIGPAQAEKTKVCRVLKFDLPSENKENSILTLNMNMHKQMTLAEHSLLCNDNGNEKVQLFTMNTNAKGDMTPLHSSTPKCLMYKSKNHIRRSRSKNDIKVALEPKDKMKKKAKKVKVKLKPTFKSYCLTRGAFYQCSKCSNTFDDGMELHCHIKKNHKSFIFTMHPLYQCAICKAKFFNNHYLNKHVKHHSGTKKSGIRY